MRYLQLNNGFQRDSVLEFEKTGLVLKDDLTVHPRLSVLNNPLNT